MPYIENEQYRLYYECRGEGKPLFFLHGLGGSIRQINDTWIAKEGIRLITLDQQGHGDSSMGGNLSFDTMAEDVVRVANTLHIKCFDLAGISMGAAVGLRTAILHPERIHRLILIRNAWINQPMQSEFIQLYARTADFLKRRDRGGFLQTTEFQNMKRISAHAAASLWNYFDDPAALRYPEKFRILPQKKPFTSWNECEKLTTEALIIATHHDPIHSFSYSEQIAGHLANARLMEIIAKDIDASQHRQQLNDYIYKFIMK